MEPIRIYSCQRRHGILRSLRLAYRLADKGHVVYLDDLAIRPKHDQRAYA